MRLSHARPARPQAASEGSFPLVHIAFDEAERWELADLPHPQRADGTLDDDFFFQLLPVAIREIGAPHTERRECLRLRVMHFNKAAKKLPEDDMYMV